MCRFIAVSLFAVTVLVGLSERAQAADRFVSTEGSDATNDCLTVGSPCRTLGHALSQAESGDTVKVAAGLYRENITINTATVLSITGGWSEDFTAQDPAGTPSVLRAAAELPVVSIVSEGIAIDVVVDGFTIERGKNLGSFPGPGPCMEGIGGGMCLYVRSAGGITALLSRLLVQKNNARDFGGGLATDVFNPGSSLALTVTDCTFTKNKASFGGGVDIFTSQVPTVNVTIDRARFLKNRGDAGGGLAVGQGFLPTGLNAQVLIRDSVFQGNRARESSNSAGNGQGGGLLAVNTGCDMTGCPVTVENTVFFKNGAKIGGGIQVGGGIELSNVTVTKNTATLSNAQGGSGGGGVLIFSDGDAGTIRNSILWGNRGVQPRDLQVGDPIPIDLDHSNVRYQGGPVTDLGGNIDANPMFVSGKDLHLGVGSPAVDTGTCIGAPATDFDGNPRPSGLGCDMGAYEFQF